MDRNEELKKYITSTLSQLKTEKARFEADMKETCSYLRHRTKDPHSPVTEIPIYNTAPIDAINTCVHGVAGYLLSPSIRWFKYIVHGKNFEKGDQLTGAEDWLEDVTDIQYMLYGNSRFYANTQEALKDSMITGTSYEMITDRLADQKKIIFEVYSPFECYIAENSSGDVDTFFREYTMTAKQAYDRFGEKLPAEVKRFLEELENPYTECTFVHAIYPRKEYQPGIAAATSKKFASVHYSSIGDTIIDESGFDEFPLAIHRWRKVSGTAYGVGLAMDYLPEIKRVNNLQKQYDIGVQFQASPMLQAPEVLRNRYVYRPGAVNYAPANAGKPEVVSNQLNIQYLGAQITELEQKLQRLMYADLFNVLMRQERQRTAYEVEELKGEGLILLSAIIGNMQNEKLVPLVLRTFHILYKTGLLPQPPEELVKASNNGQIDIELDGPLAQRMKAYHKTNGLEQGLAAISAGLQIFPNSIVNFDGDEYLRELATAKGVPQSIIRELPEVRKIQAEQARQQQEAARQQQMMAQSEMLKNMGYDASNAMQLAGNQQAAPGLLGGVA